LLQARVGNADEISKLLDQLTVGMILLNKTPSTASLELRERHSSLDETVSALVREVNSLSAEAKEAWGKCDYRRFNIGFRAGNAPHERTFTIGQRTVESVASIGGEIVVTIYVPSEGPV
jgi:hypothetical protein